MTMFSVRVPDDTARRFDLAAATAGGRSAKLRQLIAAAAGDAAAEGAAGPRVLRSGARLMVRLSPADIAALDLEAARMGLRRAAWVAALVRRRMQGKPMPSRTDEEALLAILGELRRIAVNLGQMARALDGDGGEGRPPPPQLACLDDLRAEIRGHLRGLREVLEGNLAYWEVKP